MTSRSGLLLLFSEAGVFSHDENCGERYCSGLGHWYQAECSSLFALISQRDFEGLKNHSLFQYEKNLQTRINSAFTGPFTPCGRWDLNPHDIAATRSLVLLVCQFRHFRMLPGMNFPNNKKLL